MADDISEAGGSPYNASYSSLESLSKHTVSFYRASEAAKGTEKCYQFSN
jgi:hypothetical protein